MTSPQRSNGSDKPDAIRFGGFSHPYHPGVAVRIVCWFPDASTVVAVVGGEKAAIGDLWYDSAAPRAELAVDQWQLTHPPRPEG
jgi:hypothetical protein